MQYRNVKDVFEEIWGSVSTTYFIYQQPLKMVPAVALNETELSLVIVD